MATSRCERTGCKERGVIIIDNALVCYGHYNEVIIAHPSLRGKLVRRGA